MNVQFLKDISEAYIIDSALEQTPEQIFEDLYDIVKFLQNYDLKLYNELYETTKLKQQRILKNYLDSTYFQETLTEVDIVIPGTLILATVIGAIFHKSIAKGISQSISIVGKSFETLGKWLARHGKYSQIRYAIIQENTRKCYVKCGVQKPSDINAGSYLAIKTSSNIGGRQTVEQATCLRECYIDELIDVIALHMENYFACLKKTGSFEAVQKTESDDIMRMVSSTNVAAACESYYNAAREGLDNFYRVLELVYVKKHDDDKRLEKVNKLRSKIYEARQIVQNSSQKEIQRYGDAPFQSPQARPAQRQGFKPRQGQRK